jgi:voltage-gated potassium channel
MPENLDQRASDHGSGSLRDRTWRIIFLSDTPAARAFDVVLLWIIAASVLVVIFETAPELAAHRHFFVAAEWVFTVLFTIEYFVRIWVVRRKRAYLFSFYGIIDLLSILPSYLTLFLPGLQHVLVVRILRLLRVFRILKMTRHLGEANLIFNAMRNSLPKITVFLFLVFSITVILGTAMYEIEGVLAGNEGYRSVPDSIYWAITTISTVGFGDITPITPLGKTIATVIMLIGYGIIAVPTGIVTAELNLSLAQVRLDERRCGECGHVGHDPKARYCKMCGQKL